MIWFWVASVAMGADLRVAGVLAEGTSIVDVVADTSDETIGVLEGGTGQLRVLNLSTWETGAHDLCDGAGTGIAAAEVAGETKYYVGCDDGTVGIFDITLDAPHDGSIDLASGAVLGLAASGSDIIVVTENPEEGGKPVVHHIDGETGTVDGVGSFPVTLGLSGYVDIGALPTSALIAHGSDNLSKVDLATGGAVQRDATVTTADVSDVMPLTTTPVLAAGGEVGVVAFATESNDLSLALGSGVGIELAAALAFHDDLLLVADDGAGAFVGFSYGGTGLPGDTVLATADYPEGSDAGVVEAATVDGYTVAGTTDGQLWVVTERPWVEVLSVSPDSALSGDLVDISFTSDVAGDWSLLLGAASDDDGEVIASGTIDAGGTGSTTVTVDDDYSEGTNLLRLVVDDGSHVGHDSASISVDNPPGAVDLYDTSLGFGNAQLTLSFDGLEDEDLDHYTVFITTYPFSAEQWDSCDDDTDPCGPEFDGDDDIDPPIEVSSTPGSRVTTILSPLTNGQTYYIAVRAYDTGGQEGPMSDVVTGQPEETFGAAALAGEQGGFCGVVAPVSMLVAGLGALGAALRRRRSGALLGGLCALGLMGSADAFAHDDVAEEDEPAARGSFTMHYGPVWLTDTNVTDVIGEDGNQILWLEFGPSLATWLDINGGVGFFQELGWLQSESGASSSEHDMLTALPLSLSATLSLDLLDEQILVPYVTAGGEAWLWKENWWVNPDVGGDEQISGGKFGYHYGGGLNLLLDRIEPARASRLQARTGIADSFLTAQYRVQSVGESAGGLTFSGESLTFGLKLVY